MKNLIKAVLVVGAVCLSSLVAIPAQAVSAHCDVPSGSVKVETDGTSNIVQTNLAPGTPVCVKAGTETTDVVVASDGTITQTAITNHRGNARGISYYVGLPCTDCPSS